MNSQSLHQQIHHLYEVEKLSMRQIALQLNIDRKKVSRILRGNISTAKKIKKMIILDPFSQLIEHWYQQYPKLKALQIYQRLQSYGYKGSYPSVVEFTKSYRVKKLTAYHRLIFLPGQEAQVDWFFLNHETLGKVAGFVYVLSYSRYAYGVFYPKTTLEFFVDGHIQCFKHLGGLAHTHRYDNLKSVVIKRTPTIEYNSQFLDFARHYAFSIHLCNPAKGNEKGRVERFIRDIRVWLYAQKFQDLEELNQKFHSWLGCRNNTKHRSTQQKPTDLLVKEKLLRLPEKEYLARRIVPAALVSKTCLVSFETNKYSVPSAWVSKQVQLIIFPKSIEVWINTKKIAIHKRCFEKNKIIENPLHAQILLNKSPQFKFQRIYQFIQNLDANFQQFLEHQDDHQQQLSAAYHLFKLLKTHSKVILISAIRELNQMKSFRIKALDSLLNLPGPKDGDPLWPKKTELLNLKYEERNINDYD